MDGNDIESYGRSSGVDPVNVSALSVVRVGRGGGFDSLAPLARSASRGNFPSRSDYLNLGLRPAQGIKALSFIASPSRED